MADAWEAAYWLSWLSSHLNLLMNRSFSYCSKFAITSLFVAFGLTGVAQNVIKVLPNLPIQRSKVLPRIEQYFSIKVQDERGEGIPFARITSVHQKINFSTDSLGKTFAKLASITDSVSIEAFGFESVTVAAIKLYQPIVLKADYKTIKEVVIVSPLICCIKRRIDHYCQYHAVTVKTIEKEKQQITKLSLTHTLSVFPNPAPKGSILHLRLAQNVSSPVQIQLFDAAGKSYLITQSTASYSGIIPLQLPFNLAAGNYWVKLTNPLTKQSWTQGCVVQ